MGSESDSGEKPEREPDIEVWVNPDRQPSDQRALLSWVADNHPTVEHVETADGFPPEGPV